MDASRAQGRAAGISGAAARARAWFVAGPAYPPAAGDLAAVDVFGLRLPVRATAVVALVTLVVLLDYHGRIDELLGFTGASDPGGFRERAIGRLVLLGIVPLLFVVAVLRDRPGRYGVRFGDWRAGIAVAIAGCVAMTPVVVLAAGQPDFRAWYGPHASSLADVVVTTAIEVVPAEFFFRGFLLFALLRAIGPLAVVIATLPFAFVHLGKPEIETLSTLAGGLAYGWLNWRTGSVLWSGLAHTYILSLMVLLAAA